MKAILAYQHRQSDGYVDNINTPDNHDPGQPRPLVLALHPGGEKTPYYGAQFMRSLFLPGLRELNPIMVARTARRAPGPTRLLRKR